MVAIHRLFHNEHLFLGVLVEHSGRESDQIMASMSKIERVRTVIAGQSPDRPPVGFWHHFGADERAGKAAVDAHLKFLATHDLDFVKVFFDSGYPHHKPITSTPDLAGLSVLDGDVGVFGEHLDTIRALSAELNGEVLMVTTVFNAWATLRGLLRPGPYVAGAGPSPVDNPASRRVAELVAEDRGAVGQALAVIGESLSNFARACVEAGADGIFVSVRDDWVDTPDNGNGTYDELVRRSDLRVLDAASDAEFNMLHVCGRAENFAAFADYPVHVLNWADRTAGPAIEDVVSTLKPAPCAGLDHSATLVSGDEAACANEVRDAVSQAGDRPMMIAPGCTYDPNRVPHAHLAAVRRAVDAL